MRALPLVIVALAALAMVATASSLLLNEPEMQIPLAGADEATISAAFVSFERAFYRAYASPVERAHRMGVFRSNYQLIAQMNANKAGGEGVTFGVNQFADLTQDEFRATVLMPPRTPTPFPPSRFMRAASADPAPDAFDWRDHGAVTPVKDQGSAGTCYTFSAVGNIEGQWFRAGHQLVSLSEEQAVDCDARDCGVFGGWPNQVMEYFMEVGGVMSEADYPYCVGTGACYPCMAPGWNKTFCGEGPLYCNATEHPCSATKASKFTAFIRDWKAIDKDEGAIKQVLYTTGPLSVALDATMLQFYLGGVFDPPFCSKTALDHAVLMVGYGTEKTLLGSKDYWIVKNSWGGKWGEKGYFKILRGKGTCGINTQVVTAVV